MNLNQDSTYYNSGSNLKKAYIIVNLYELRNTQECVASILNIDPEDVKRTTSLYNCHNTQKNTIYNKQFCNDENRTIKPFVRLDQLQYLNKYNLLELQQKLVQTYDLRIEPIKIFHFIDFNGRAFLYMQLLNDCNIQYNIQYTNNNSIMVITLIS